MEITAPRIFISQLVQSEGMVSSHLVLYYIFACLNLGQSISDVLADLSTDIDVTQLPMVSRTIIYWSRV